MGTCGFLTLHAIVRKLLHNTPTESVKPPKPKLRGVSHLVMTLVAVPMTLQLYSLGTDIERGWQAAVYSVAFVLLFCVSALYHVPMWAPNRRAQLRKLDRSMIYVFIAGTYTPVVRQSVVERAIVLPAAWTAAMCGVAFTLLGSGWPRYVTALPYVVLGWGAVSFMPAVSETFGSTTFWCITGAGLHIPSARYAMRSKAKPMARYVWLSRALHLLVILAAVLHFKGIDLPSIFFRQAANPSPGDDSELIRSLVRVLRVRSGYVV